MKLIDLPTSDGSILLVRTSAIDSVFRDKGGHTVVVIHGEKMETTLTLDEVLRRISPREPRRIRL